MRAVLLPAPTLWRLAAGHASSALWLVSVAVYWLPARPARAAGMALLALLPGLALGWLQQLRGAHFLTHTLWSAWIACALVLLLIVTLQAALSWCCVPVSRAQRRRRSAAGAAGAARDA